MEGGHGGRGGVRELRGGGRRSQTEKKAREARQEGKRRERELGDAVRAAEIVVHRAEDKGGCEARRRRSATWVMRSRGGAVACRSRRRST